MTASRHVAVVLVALLVGAIVLALVDAAPGVAADCSAAFDQPTCDSVNEAHDAIDELRAEVEAQGDVQAEEHDYLNVVAVGIGVLIGVVLGGTVAQELSHNVRAWDD